MQEPGLDRTAWEGESQTFEDSTRANATQALTELDRLVGRMLKESGYDLTDPVVREGEERKIVADYLAARKIVKSAQRGSRKLSPGDVAAAINGYRAVSEHLAATRLAADAQPTQPKTPDGVVTLLARWMRRLTRLPRSTFSGFRPARPSATRWLSRSRSRS